MTNKTKYILGIAILIFALSALLPSRLTSYGSDTFFSFAITGQIGYSVYMLLLFPIALVLAVINKIRAAFVVSTVLLLTNITLFEDLLYALTHFSHVLKNAMPFLINSVLFSWLFYQALNRKSWSWFSISICLLIVSYIWFNDNNCTTDFISDMGTRTHDLRIWFQNCGTYYAWWTAPILLNIGLFNEIKAVQKSN